MRSGTPIAVAAVLAITLAACRSGTPGSAARVTVLAPRYLEGILEPAKEQFEEENGISVGIVYTAHDSVIAQAKIIPRIDVVLAGGYKGFQAWRKDTLVVGARSYCPFRLSFVLAGRADGPSATKIEDLRKDEFKRVVIIDPEAGYEGFLAAYVLKKRRVWDRLQDKLILANSAAHLRSFIETREADAAVAFESSLSGMGGITILQQLDEYLGQSLIQCGAVMKKSQNKASAQAFLDLLGSRLCPIYKINGVYRMKGR